MTDAAERWDGERLGILGGTFDPPHVGHTRMAMAARAALGLDRVFLSPAPHPPHKLAAHTTEYAHRLAMLKAALADTDGLFVTHIEENDATSYTVELLRACRVRTAADLYFIVGADSLAELASWREPAEVMRLATLVVFPRTDEVVRAPTAPDASLVVFEAPVIDVSSTEIRARLARGDTDTTGLSPAVASYIAQHRLYARA
jgi:nicotinate-nucleotide adenylyltransferase